MKHWLNVSLILCGALTLFGAGLTLGHLGWSPQTAIAHPSSYDDPDGSDSFGGDGGFFNWQQNDDRLKISVGGPDPAYIGYAELADGSAWIEHGDGEMLYTPEVVELDLAPVETLTFYRLEPIGSLEEGVFLPCAELPTRCFPIRPPVGPPPPDGRWLMPGRDSQPY